MDDETRLVSQSELAGQSAGFTVAPGALLSHTYRIDKLLARGGMGEIYRATHAKLGTEHAIKIMLPELAKDQKVIDLFTREAAVLRNVRNEAVVGYDGVVCDEDGHLYLIMEFVDGPALSVVLQDGPLAVADVLTLRDRLAMGLGAAHEKGVIHRDMSPDNVILPGGRLENAKIIDFGIAKLADPEVRTVIGGDFAGKYSYASPEQLGLYGGDVDARSDIYSAGLVLAAAAIGRPLDMGKTHMSVLEARRAVPDLSEVPAALRDQIAWMLEPNPENRPQSMAELVPSAAASARTGRRAGARPAKPASGGRGGLIAGAAALALLAIAGGGYLLIGSPDGGPADPDAGPTPIAEPQPASVPPPQPAPDPAAIRARLDGLAEQFDCAGLSITLNEALGVVVTGFVSSDADLSRLVAGLRAIPGVRGVNEAVSVRPWPFCAAIGVLETQAGLEPGVPGRPALRPNNPSLVYYEGNVLVVRASATRLFDGYLYVDFIDKQGSIYHLFPSDRRPDNAVFAGQEITVGGGPGGHPGDHALAIGRPFGTDMIVAVSSPVPLFPALRPFEEPASSYLQALSGALTEVSRQGTDPVASYVFITSREPR